MAMKMISITDIDGFKLGNAENREKGTGCTVIISEEGAVGGVDVRGGGPATRETDLLRSENTVNAVNAVVLSGGSAFGLEAASGVMRELAEMKIGFDVGDDIVVPIVCGASLYDLPVGDPKAFPDIYMGAQAVRNAYEGSFARGNHGAGTGATVGKLKGYERAMKAGLGAFACGDGVIEVGAVAAVNAVGDIYNGAGKIVAGLRSEDGKSIYGTIKTLKGMVHDRIKLTDDNTSFINRSEVDEALAAAAKQYEEESAARQEAEAETDAEPAEETSEEFIPENPDADEAEENFAENEEVSIPVEAEEEFIPETPDVDEAEESSVENEEVSIPVEAEEEFIPETPETDETEESVPETPEAEETEESFIENAEVSIPVVTAEPEADEFIPETSEADAEEENFAENAEVSIPVVSSEAESDEEPVEESAEEAATETVEEPEQEAPEYIAEEEAEEPEPLTREEMGYDIVFNTTISCLITNAALTKSQANKLASILHDAYARAIKPVHGTLDGDTVFVLATGKQQVNFDAFAALATDVMQYAIIDGAMSAESAYGIPAARDM